MLTAFSEKVTGLHVDGKSIKTFYNDVVKHPLFYFPFLTLSIMAYLPSITNTKRQFEDFRIEIYFGDNGAQKVARWGMWLLARSLGLAGNDIANKYLGLIFLILGALVITAVFYCLTTKEGLLKYTIMATTITVFPLINEIWGYNVANLIVCINYLLCGIVVYGLIIVKGNLIKKLLLGSIPFIWISSSYEAGLFTYVTLVFAICFYLYIKRKISAAEYFSVGILLGVPLIIGSAIGVLIGYFISVITGTPYIKCGDTRSHWGEVDVFYNLIDSNFDRYFLRALIYVPITIFVFAVIILVTVLIKSIFERKIMVLLSGIFLFFSIFLLPMYQCFYLPYRVAQNVTVFTAFVFFLGLERSEAYSKFLQKAIGVFMILICLIQSSFLMNVNWIDYQIAHNDEDLVRQIGYNLTSKYYGKPVMLIPRQSDIYGLYDIYSESLHKEVIIDVNTLNGKLYHSMRGDSVIDMKYFDTNLYSVLLRGASLEDTAMELFFSYCGYEIDVISYIPEDYPEVTELVESGKLHTLEIVDMGEYVVVGL